MGGREWDGVHRKGWRGGFEEKGVDKEGVQEQALVCLSNK